MSSTRRTLSLLMLTLLIGCGDDPMTGPDLPPPDTREGLWARDVDQLARGLEERHVDLFARVSRERFASEVMGLIDQIPSLDDAGVMVGMMRLVALVGDSHTTLGWQGFRSFRRLPLELEWFEDGLFVVGASEDFADALGARVRRLGMVTAETALERMRELVPHENESWFRNQAPSLLVVPEILREQLVIADASTVDFELETQASEILTISIPAGVAEALLEPENANRPLYRQRPEDNYWFTFLDDPQVLYAQYRRASDMPGEPVAAFTTRFLQFLDTNPVRAVVLDLRNNPGGNSSLLQPMIDGLAARPRFSQSDTLYVVIGRTTFSSALLNALELQQRTGGTLVGEPTGGKPNHFGEVRDFRLTHALVPVTYSTRFFEILRGSDPPSLEPDIRVALTSRDFLEGRDPVLETILGFVGM